MQWRGTSERACLWLVKNESTENVFIFIYYLFIYKLNNMTIIFLNTAQ